jgi:hypothetical protein
VTDNPLPDLASLVDLSDLLVSTVDAVVKSQERLDAYTQQRQAIYDTTPDGELAIPPLWFAISSVAIELELSTTFTHQTRVNEQGEVEQQSRMFCKPLNPLAVGLFGYQASAGLRVRLQMGPRGVLPIKAGAV